MGSKTYKVNALVLRKTKLKEKDLIVSLLDESGSLIQAVAKGARKPGGSLAARLELFSTVNALLAQGRSLDIVCEAKLLGSAKSREFGLEQASCAAPLAELLCIIAQPDLPQRRLFEMSASAFGSIGASEPASSATLLSASLWKVMALAGFRPMLARCALCSDVIDYESLPASVPFSFIDGGVVCGSCKRTSDSILVEQESLRWIETLIMTRFADVASLGIDDSSVFSTLQLAHQWVRTHTGRDLKSLDFIFTSGLF